jgi:rhamnosyltransferase
MSPPPPPASVIVRTLDSAGTLPACLRSLLDQTVRPEIIVVDSGSRDRTLELASRMGDRVLSLAPGSFSYGRALNLGARAAAAPIHFALSSHCVVPRRDWIERSLAHYARADVAGTNGQQTRPDGSPLREALYVGAQTSLPDPFWGFSNHASSWRGEVWREHPFDEFLPASEDFEWSDRVLAAGYTLVFDPALTVRGDHRTRQGALALYRRSVREYIGTASCRAVEPPTLRESVRRWWSEHPAGTKKHRQRLSPYRIAVIAGRYRGGRAIATGRRREPQTDILYVASGTTEGQRRADHEMITVLRELGLRVRSVSGDYTLPRRVRRWVWSSMLTIDLFEAVAIRRAAIRGLKEARPAAVIYATTHAAMLSPRQRAPRRVAIRFDTPAALSRQGRVYAIEHWLERLQFSRAHVLMPTAVQVEPALQRLLPPRTPVKALPIPIELGHRAQMTRRDPLVVVYAGSPEKKGLDLTLAAWALAAPAADGRRLAVTGISREQGRSWLDRCRVEEPAGVEWLGVLSAGDHRALTARAEIYLSTSRYEDYGIAQLEALADGAMLVCAPAPGPFLALPLARELAPRLVAVTRSAEDVASALLAAFEMTDDERALYRRLATERLSAFSRTEVRRRLRAEILPVLLS